MKIALLMNFEHRVGMEYLSEFIKNDITLDIIITVRDNIIEEKSKSITRARVGTYFKEHNLSELLDGIPIPVYFTQDFNNKYCEYLIKKQEIDLIILGGTGMIKKNIISAPKIGTINCHPGLIPDYRGCTNVEWALYNDDHVGATAYFLTEDIDLGPVIFKEIMPIYRGMTYEEVRVKIDKHCAEAMIKAVKIIKEKGPDVAQAVSGRGRYYRIMNEKRLNIVKQKLDGCLYKCYAD